MRSAEFGSNRAFVLRMNDGEILHETIDEFCRENGILRASVTLTGAVDAGSVLVSGPSLPLGDKVSPERIVIPAPCELSGTGTVFPDEEGRPISHLHGSVGRVGFSAVGDLCHGMKVWLVMEAVIIELSGDCGFRRIGDSRIDGKLLEIERWHQRRFSDGRYITLMESRLPSSGICRAASRRRSSSSSSTRYRETVPGIRR